MKNMRRFCAALLILAMALSVLPASAFAGAEKTMEQSIADVVLKQLEDMSAEELEALGQADPTVKDLKEKLLQASTKAPKAEVIEESAYASADALFEEIDAMEEKMASKNPSQAQLSKAAAEVVKASECYVEGSLEFNGDSFSWWTEDGIRCMYDPRMQEIQENMVPAKGGPQDMIVNEPEETKGGTSTSKQVYLVAPYYGYDDSFTDQYKQEATRIAKAIGDTDGYTLYSGAAATVDKVAEAVSKGAVVIFDSHGTTDYNIGDDCVTGANYSYLCLNSASGLTSTDYQNGAVYLTSGGAGINGKNITSHMTSNSPGGLVWMAICLSMATNTLAEPMRQKGVEVAYGYSQSVTFGGEYLFEEAFWDKMLEGKNVSQAISHMKTTWGEWDSNSKIGSYYGWPSSYIAYNLTEARNEWCAFPIVVSDEDSHPGQRNRSGFYGADSQQTVKSTYYFNITNNGGSGSGSGSGTTGTTNYQKLRNYISSYGTTNDDGYKALTLTAESGDTFFMFDLINISGAIQFAMTALSESGDTGILTMTHFNLLENGSNALPMEFTVGLFYRDDLVDMLSASGTLTKNTFNKNTSYTINRGSQYGYISASDASELLTSGLQTLAAFWDQNIYSRLGFGLKGLGFIKYQGLGNLECSHTYDNACDATCNSCGETRPVNHTYSGNCDPTCNVCGAGRTPTASHTNTYSYVDQTYHNCTCSVCGTIQRTGHRWQAGEVLQTPTEDVPGLRRDNCPDCGATRETVIYMAGTGDLDGNGTVNEDDAIYLLQHVLMPNMFPLYQDADYDSNGTINEDDAIYLLQHVLMPHMFPLQ